MTGRAASSPTPGRDLDKSLFILLMSCRGWLLKLWNCGVFGPSRLGFGCRSFTRFGELGCRRILIRHSAIFGAIFHIWINMGVLKRCRISVRRMRICIA